MTDKIYEYKDDQDWYVGTWGDYSYISSFVNPEEIDRLNESIYRLLDALELGQSEEDGLRLHILRQSSDFRLFSFVADMINQAFGKSLQVRKQKDAILVIEGNQLLSLHLPKKGVTLTDFFDDKAEAINFGDTILIATHNEGKTKEFRAFFEPLGYKVENLNHYPDLPEVEETGMTFEENARLKAETISKLTGKMVLADDSGLKVDKLGGLPGIWSARFSGPDATDARNNAKLLHELAMVFEQKDRSAQFHCTLVIAAPDRDSLVVEADWAGYISPVPRGENGFGYDPLFLVGETGKTAAELELEEKNQISHRALALKKLLEAFPAWQAK